MCFLVAQVDSHSYPNLYLTSHKDMKYKFFGNEMWIRIKFMLYQYELENFTDMLIGKYGDLNIKLKDMTFLIKKSSQTNLLQKYLFFNNFLFSQMEKTINDRLDMNFSKSLFATRDQLILSWIKQKQKQNPIKFPKYYSVWLLKHNKFKTFIFNPRYIKYFKEYKDKSLAPKHISILEYMKILKYKINELNISTQSNQINVDIENSGAIFELSNENKGNLGEFNNILLKSNNISNICKAFRSMVNFLITDYFFALGDFKINTETSLKSKGTENIIIDSNNIFIISEFLTQLENLVEECHVILKKILEEIKIENLDSTDEDIFKQYLKIMYESILLENFGLFLKNIFIYDEHFNTQKSNISIDLTNFKIKESTTYEYEKILLNKFKISLSNSSLFYSSKEFIFNIFDQIYVQNCIKENQELNIMYAYKTAMLDDNTGILEFFKKNSINHYRFAFFDVFNESNIHNKKEKLIASGQILNNMILSDAFIAKITKRAKILKEYIFHKNALNLPSQNYNTNEILTYMQNDFFDKLNTFLNPNNAFLEIEMKQRKLIFHEVQNVYEWCNNINDSYFNAYLSYLPYFLLHISEILRDLQNENTQHSEDEKNFFKRIMFFAKKYIYLKLKNTMSLLRDI
jgi:hypothetical protein